MDFASRYQKMNLHDCLGRKRKDELQTEDSFTDINFAVPPGIDVSNNSKYLIENLRIVHSSKTAETDFVITMQDVVVQQCIHVYTVHFFTKIH